MLSPSDMPRDMMAVLLAAGQSNRFGGDTPKPYLTLAGKPVYRHALDTLAAMPRCAGGVVVVAENAPTIDDLPDGWITTIGGATRAASVLAGLEALVADAPRFVFIHDAARAFIPAHVCDALLAALDDGAEAAIPALPVADSLRRREGDRITGEISRDGLVAVQTPQAFVFEKILALHRNNKDARLTDDSALALAAGIDVVCACGDPQLMKITRRHDFTLAEKIASAFPHAKGNRHAIGMDSHRFGDTETDSIMLGGVAIPHGQKIAAHSDGDVILHALTDALLGLIAAGDIGTHFPPTDPQWRDAESRVFVAIAKSMLDTAGGVLTFADITVMCDTPKITPHRDAIRQKISALLECDMEKVSVKATTSEGMGILADSKGIAAMVVATAEFKNNGDEK